MGRFALAGLSVAFVAGVACARWPFAVALLAVVACAAVAFGAARRRALGTCGAILFAASAGIVDAALFDHAADLRPDQRLGRYPVVVLDARPVEGDLVATTVRFADGTNGSVDLRGAPEPVGERLLLRGRREPFDVPRNPGDPSARDLAAERGLSWRVVRARVLARAPPDARDPALVLPRLRAWASARVHATFPEPEATILAGAMWGERGPLAPDLRDEFQDTGTVHVLVTAGLHLGVVAAVAIFLLERARCGRIGAAFGAIAIVWAYAALSGDHLPSVRAATMLTFALVARAAGREAASWNALAAAALAIVALRPASIGSASFALSFSCVAAIFAFAEPIASALETIGAPSVVRECLAVAFATQLGTWPLTAATFLVIAPYAPLANALVVPVVGVALLGGFATLALAPFPPLAAFVASVVSALVDWIVSVVRFVAALPGAHVVATPPPGWALAAYDAALVLAALSLRHGAPRRAAVLVACASALCLWPPRAHAHDLRITAIDVGQADALLIETPGGHAYLVDAGGRLERGPPAAGASAAEQIGERVVVPFLVRRGIHHLDAVLVSHPHGDHKSFHQHMSNEASDDHYRKDQFGAVRRPVVRRASHCWLRAIRAALS